MVFELRPGEEQVEGREIAGLGDAAVPDQELLEDRLVEERAGLVVGAAVSSGAVRREADGDVEHGLPLVERGVGL
ncbi:MAG: hypothetical protein ACRENL_03540 [Candidatus Dormibacteria bacterium]